jgi:alanine dehydrogenase
MMREEIIMDVQSAQPSSTIISGARQLAFVSSETIRAMHHWPEAVDRLRTAYSNPHSPMAIPPRAVARGASGWLRTMSAIPPGARFMGAKVFGIGPKKMVNYAIVLIEQDSGLIAAIVDGAAITAIRTAATSALAIDRLAKSGPIRLGLLGSGVEASAHVAAAAHVRPLSKITVFSPSRTRRVAFAASVRQQFGVECATVESADEAAEDADVLIAAARSRDESPILHAHMLRPGMIAVSIGSTLPEQREADVTAIDACDLIVCDAVDEVLNETGDMLAAKAAQIDVGTKTISLNALLSNQCEDRVAVAKQVMFKSVGSAVQDIVIAELAYEKALAAGRLDDMGAEFYTKYV